MTHDFKDIFHFGLNHSEIINNLKKLANNNKAEKIKYIDLPFRFEKILEKIGFISIVERNDGYGNMIIIPTKKFSEFIKNNETLSNDLLLLELENEYIKII